MAMDVDLDKRYKSAHQLRAALNNVDIPIDWIQTHNSKRKKVWVGDSDTYSYKVEVTKQLISENYDVAVYKGKTKLQKKSAKCLNNVSSKEIHKKVRKILSESI